MLASQRITVFVGTRPEVIKLAPVVHEIRRRPELVVSVVATAQHRQMLEQTLAAMEVSVEHDLDVMRPGQTLASLTSRLITGVDDYLDGPAPHMAIVQGDTTTVVAAALACFYRQIPVAHVEAGLRTGNPFSPFPEEANRRMVAPLASLHFPTTSRARDNLLREGVAADAICVTGSTAIDALRLEIERQERPEIGTVIVDGLSQLLGFDIEREPFVLITGHRRESFGDGFEQITEAIRRLAERFPDHHFVYPVHLNPLVQEPVHRRLGRLDNVHLVAPQGYTAFVALMRTCEVVLTDSGGLQEEAPWLAKPVLVMRETTERPEGVETGNAVLVGVDPERIVRATATLLTDTVAYAAMAHAAQPYGDGHAAPRIVDGIVRYLGETQPASPGSPQRGDAPRTGTREEEGD